MPFPSRRLMVQTKLWTLYYEPSIISYVCVLMIIIIVIYEYIDAYIRPSHVHLYEYISCCDNSRHTECVCVSVCGSMGTEKSKSKQQKRIKHNKIKREKKKFRKNNHRKTSMCDPILLLLSCLMLVCVCSEDGREEI